MNVKDLKKFEQNIGYSFKDIEHLKIALTHKSYIDEDPTSKTTEIRTLFPMFPADVSMS